MKPGEDILELLAVAAPVALAEAIGFGSGVRPEIRWPNDLLLAGRKVAGILLESSSGESNLARVVVGIGVNLRQAPEDFPPEIAALATSIRVATGRDVAEGALLDAFLERFDRALALRDLPEWLERYRALSPSSRGAHLRLRIGEDVREGVSQGLDAQGHLLVLFPEGTTPLASAEVLEVRPSAGGY